MLKKLLSRIGIGATKIDLLLQQEVLRQGETAAGIIRISAGEVEQQLGDIEVELVVESFYKKDDHTYKIKDVVAAARIPNHTIIYPGQQLEFNFSCKVPENIPVSHLTTRYYFRTNLDIKEALDSADYDPVKVLPAGILANFLHAFESLGFIARGEAYTGKYQLFEFYPTAWLAGQLDELTFAYQPGLAAREIAGHFEIDKRNYGLLGMLADELDLDEKKGFFRFTARELASPEQARETIQQFISFHFNKLV